VQKKPAAAKVIQRLFPNSISERMFPASRVAMCRWTLKDIAIRQVTVVPPSLSQVGCQDTDSTGQRTVVRGFPDSNRRQRHTRVVQ